MDSNHSQTVISRTFIGDLPTDLKEPLILLRRRPAAVHVIVDVFRVQRLQVASERAAATSQRHQYE